MNIAIDWDGTLDRFPEFYKKILAHWPTGGNRYILTARPVTECLITRDDIALAGITLGLDVDGLIMFPKPYLYDEVNQNYVKDDGEIVFSNMKHREEHLRYVKSRYPNPSEGIYDSAAFTEDIARWKAKVCKERNIQAIFEDSEVNTKFLREQGIYVFHVDRNFKKES